MSKTTTLDETEQQSQAPRTAEQLAGTEKALGLAPTSGQAAPARAVVRMGIAPTTIEDGWRLATMMAKSDIVPKNFRGRPEDILVAVQMGMELGLPPMQSLQSICVINGRASLYGDATLALIVSSPLYADHDEYYEVDGERRDGLTAEDLKKDATSAVCTFWRAGKRTPVTRRFAIADAKKAGLWGKSGPWTEYTSRMLAMRARGFASRDAYPDLLRGIRTAEEAGDIPADDIDVQAMPPATEVKRISETAPKAGPVVVVPEVTEVMLDPATVVSVEQFAGGFTITLGNGMKVDTIEMQDALELEKFVGTKNKVRLTVTKSDTTLNLKSFAISD